MPWGTVIELILLTHNTLKSFVRFCGDRCSCCCTTVFGLQVFIIINDSLSLWSYHNAIRKVIDMSKVRNRVIIGCLNMIIYRIIYSDSILYWKLGLKHLAIEFYTLILRNYHSLNKIGLFSLKNCTKAETLNVAKKSCLDIDY